MPAGGILGKARARETEWLAETKRHDVSPIIVRYVRHIRASSLCQTYRPIINGSPMDFRLSFQPITRFPELFALRRVRDSNPRFSYKPFWCCFLLLNSGLIFQIFAFVHTGFTRCLHDFSLWKNYAKLLKIFDIRKYFNTFLQNNFIFNQYTPFPNFFQNYSNI